MAFQTGLIFSSISTWATSIRLASFHILSTSSGNYVQKFDPSKIIVDILNCTVSLSRPKSAGRVFLNTSATTLEGKLAPVLDHNLFSDESDFDVMLQGNRVKVCAAIWL